nr:hippocampus abundant transcript-like protein 1 [Coffea arabica]
MVGMWWWKNKREVRLLVHLLLPLSVHFVAEEMTKSVLVDVTTNVLCPGQSTCPEAIDLNGLQQTTVGIFKMVVLPVLGQLSDDYGRKPLLLATFSADILPFAVLAINKSKGFVYAFYVLRFVSLIFSQGSIYCIAAAYLADVVDDNKKATGFSWMMGLISASRVLGNVLARFLPGTCFFEVAIALLIFCPVYMTLFLAETVTPAPKVDQCLPYFKKAFKLIQEQYDNIRYAASVVISSPTLKSVSLALFFYELGMSGATSTLLYYLKAAFGFDKNQFSEILMVVDIGAVISQLLVLPIITPLVGEKLILCAALLSNAVYALLFGLAWAPWVTYFIAAFGVVNVLVRPSSSALISKAASSTDQGKAQGIILGVQSFSSLLSPLAMTPLTNLFLSRDAPFNCKGFSFVCASLSVAIALCFAFMLKPNTSKKPLEVDAEHNKAPLLS